MPDPYEPTRAVEPHDLEQGVRAAGFRQSTAQFDLETGRWNRLVPRDLDREVAGASGSSFSGRGR